jgi:hypothetical protein
MMMETWDREDALWFARASAEHAVSSKLTGEDLDSVRENIRCTFEDYRCSQFEQEAWALFDQIVNG